jgi:hypothetical protein
VNPLSAFFDLILRILSGERYEKTHPILWDFFWSLGAGLLLLFLVYKQFPLDMLKASALQIYGYFFMSALIPLAAAIFLVIFVPRFLIVVFGCCGWIAAFYFAWSFHSL